MNAEVKISVETITPDAARELLAANEDKPNRSINDTRVSSYAKQMKEGKWHLTGEPIIINGSRLLNGRHRLTACVRSDTPFITAVARGVATPALDVIDTGRPRSPGDTLKYYGITSANAAAAAARLFFAFDNGKINDNAWSSRSVSRSDLVDFVVEHPDEIAAALKHGYALRSIGFIQTAPSMLHLWFALRASDALGQYTTMMNRVHDGIGLESGEPALALRNWITGLSSRRTPAAEQVAAIIRSWNAHVSGTPLKIVKGWQRGQPFPEVLLRGRF